MTYNALAQGYTRRGLTLHYQSHAERVDESDVYGRTLLDLIYQGGDIELDYIARVYGTNVLSAFWPWGGGTFGVISTYAQPVATLGSGVGQAFVATATANTPAATLPATLTASKAILSPDVDQQLIYSSTARDVPIRLVCLPTETGSGSTVTVTKVALT